MSSSPNEKGPLSGAIQALNSWRSEAQFKRAVTEQDHHNVGTAREMFIKLAEKGSGTTLHAGSRIPLRVAAHIRVGTIDEDRGQHRDAYQSFFRAYDLCRLLAESILPKLDDLVFQIGRNAYSAGEYTYAISWLIQADVIACKPMKRSNLDIARIRAMLGKAYYMAGGSNISVACTTFEDLVVFAQENRLGNQLLTIWRAYYGCALYMKDRFREAWSEFEKVAGFEGPIINHKDASAWSIHRWRANTASRIGQDQDALSYYLKDFDWAIAKSGPKFSELSLKVYGNGLCSEIEKIWPELSIHDDTRGGFKTGLRGIDDSKPTIQNQARTLANNLDRLDAETSYAIERRPSSIPTSPLELSVVAPAVNPSQADVTTSALLASREDVELISRYSRSIADTPRSGIRFTQFSTAVTGTTPNTGLSQDGTPMTGEPLSSPLSVLDSMNHALSLSERLETLIHSWQRLRNEDIDRSSCRPEEIARDLVVNHHEKFDEPSIAVIAKLPWLFNDRGVPHVRLFIILVRIRSLETLNEFLNNGLSDYNVPMRRQDFQGLQLEDDVIEGFLQEQDVVLSEPTNLDADFQEVHRHFSETITFEDSTSGYRFEKTIYAPANKTVRIHKVTSVANNKSFAVKQISRTVSGASAAEVCTLKQVCRKYSTSHIIRFVSSYTDPDWFVLIMDYAQLDLEEYFRLAHAFLHGDQTMTPDSNWQPSAFDLRKAVGCLSKTLMDLHLGGYKHRDIKPANILMDKGCAKFSDWGLARQYTTVNCTSNGPVDGLTWFYAAPEVLNNQTRTKASDAWSLGLVIVDIVLCLKGLSPEWFKDRFMAYSVEYHSSGEIENTHETWRLPGHNVRFLHTCIEELKVLAPQEDNRLLCWATEMLQERAANRLTCEELYRNILNYQNGNNEDQGYSEQSYEIRYCGPCCQ